MPAQTVATPPDPSQPVPVPRNKRIRPKTYTVAVYLVGAILGLEVIMFISVFWLCALVCR